MRVCHWCVCAGVGVGGEGGITTIIMLASYLHCVQFTMKIDDCQWMQSVHIWPWMQSV